MEASKLSFSAILASATLAWTAPARPKGPTQPLMPRGERSMWPQRVRSLGSTLPVKEST